MTVVNSAHGSVLWMWFRSHPNERLPFNRSRTMALVSVFDLVLLNHPAADAAFRLAAFTETETQVLAQYKTAHDRSMVPDTGLTPFLRDHRICSRGPSMLPSGIIPGLEILSGEDDDRVGCICVIDRPRVVIGRSESCNFRLMSLTCSRQHAALETINGSYFIEDLRSRCGTCLNDTQIRTRTELRNGDLIRMGIVRLKFHQFLSSVDLQPVKF